MAPSGEDWPPPEGFLDRIARLRRALDVSLDELAREAGLARGTLSNWRDDRTPDMTSLLQVAEALGVQAMWLWNGTGDPQGERPTWPEKRRPKLEKRARGKPTPDATKKRGRGP